MRGGVLFRGMLLTRDDEVELRDVWCMMGWKGCGAWEVLLVERQLVVVLWMWVLQVLAR